ncbi:hypothetical protein OROMI_024117 [Orobanche minor]
MIVSSEKIGSPKRSSTSSIQLSLNPDADDEDYYTPEELDQLDDKSMAYLAGKFNNIRFRRNPKFKFRGLSNKF